MRWSQWPLDVTGSRGYNYAEVTAGGVSLERNRSVDDGSHDVCPGLFLVGEILDVDGRIGGFNFQWAWSSARVAARRLARRFRNGFFMPPVLQFLYRDTSPGATKPC